MPPCEGDLPWADAKTDPRGLSGFRETGIDLSVIDAGPNEVTHRRVPGACHDRPISFEGRGGHKANSYDRDPVFFQTDTTLFTDLDGLRKAQRVISSLFKEGGQFWIWLSADERKIPVQFEVKVKLGKVMGKLKQY